jgi:prevent-host-death family protein
MEQYNIHAAKTQLSALVARAAAGEVFVIAKAGRPLAVVGPYESAAPPERVGFMEGQIRVPDDFDRLGEGAIAELFGCGD